MQHPHGGRIDLGRRRAVEVFNRAAAGDPAVADAQPDVKAGEMIGGAGLRKSGREQAGHIGAAVRTGAQAHLGHLVERVVGGLAEHIGVRLVAKLTEEIVHPLHFALDEVSRDSSSGIADMSR